MNYDQRVSKSEKSVQIKAKSKFQIITSSLLKGVVALSILGLLAMWIYAFGFASKESVNKIGDTVWTQNAESICKKAADKRMQLVDTRQISDAGPDALLERAKIVDLATDTLEEALKSIAQLQVSDEKGKAIVPLWLLDYQQLVKDRREYASMLRSGINKPFSETMVDGLPISEKISTFAADNRMSSCKAPMDLSI
ncbi:MAG: hypothetical protein EBR53_00225 [Actinobacteria bacterium]|jgi:hypothetical protein|nr:hypothetical protein [Actinomycetota bacterium]